MRTMNKTKIFNLSKYFIRISRETVEKSLLYSYRGRFKKKHDMIGHWIKHINAGSRQDKKLLSHMDTSGAACCADTLDKLQSLLKLLKLEPSFEPVISNHALIVAASSIKQQDDMRLLVKTEAISEPIKDDLSGDLPKQENSKLKKEEPVESSKLALKSGKQKVEGLSLIELFTPEQVKEHIRSLRKWNDQSKDEAEKNQALDNSTSEKFCQLCASEKLTFEPPTIYCTPCDTRIKRNAIYFTVEDGETRRYFCKPCYDKSEGDTILAKGTSIAKERLEQKKNEGPEEWWVQCDKCEAWQHQICALFNPERYEGEETEYICPNCYITEVEQNEKKPLLQSVVIGAKELPRTLLSDHIEQRLFKRLKQERIERAKLQGTSYDEIPSAESLVVRVVSSVDKMLEVKTRFREYFREYNFPSEFPYKSKVILLFQKIEGVDVLLLGQYVQEFGSECSFPNQRCVYLAYLDSVKYFRPDIKSANGEALRTFVYQEILISYLDYCKLRGFTSCYLWSCPPLDGVEYILYCHPKIQKTPKTKKLREWHLAWLRKAANEGIVVETTNLYDHFFLQTGECRAKITTSRLPYFDGDYWPRKAEVIIQRMSEEDNGTKENKKIAVNKTNALNASGQSNVSENASKDQLLMQKLGEDIHPDKEDYIVVHLHHCCTHCCTVMVTGNRWVCSQCKNFQLCDRCYDAEQKREDIERHPVNQKDNHDLYPVEISHIPSDTKDKDEIIESVYFDSRNRFQILCEVRHYQYDTPRRAKHSSMMVLYRLHNTCDRDCNACGFGIYIGRGWRCKGCEYDLCNVCYIKEGNVNHPHKLKNLSALYDQKVQNKEGRQQVL